MERTASLAEVLEAVARLSDEDQAALVEIINRRASEPVRKRIAADASEARREFEDGRCRPATPDELMDEILS
ncbi:hypothetical protein TA3x_002880 [Tundrisphaera sp. TA3]|uniref:hypothetical protein n=1 Tax=Tundrisphaera sp. TA3 TaxID=3435775 RepID=UPI003EBE5C37